MTETIPRQQAELIKRTAWLQMQPRIKPAKDDKVFADKAVRMLNYVACLNSAMYDLESALRDTGKFRQNIARRCRMSQKIAGTAHQAAYTMLASISSNVGRQYNDAFESAWTKIDECILLSSPEREYNIVIALCRLITRLNRELGHRYYFAPAAAIERIPSMLADIDCEDHRIDNIIERNTI